MMGTVTIIVRSLRAWGCSFGAMITVVPRKRKLLLSKNKIGGRLGHWNYISKVELHISQWPGTGQLQ